MELKKIVRLLGPLMVEGVLSVKSHSHDRVVEMLGELQFITRGIVKTDNSLTISLQILDVELLYRLLAGEANRFLLASRVSYARSSQDQLNNASWQAIENYYAAYFGVHYLLRLTGVSITSLDSRSTMAIERSNYGAPLDLPVPSGLYITKYDDASKMLTLTKNTKKSGGSHQDAWKLWTDFIEELRLQTNIDPVEYAGISIGLAEHKIFLSRSTAKYNPPEIRGEINYQFKGGSWVFEKNSSRSIGVLQRAISGDHAVALSTEKSPEGLIVNNRFIIGLARAVFMHASAKYPRGVCRALENKYKSYVF